MEWKGVSAGIALPSAVKRAQARYRNSGPLCALPRTYTYMNFVRPWQNKIGGTFEVS